EDVDHGQAPNEIAVSRLRVDGMLESLSGQPHSGRGKLLVLLIPGGTAAAQVRGPSNAAGDPDQQLGASSLDAQVRGADDPVRAKTQGDTQGPDGVFVVLGEVVRRATDERREEVENLGEMG